jgi:hypothetical protein
MTLRKPVSGHDADRVAIGKLPFPYQNRVTAGMRALDDVRRDEFIEWDAFRIVALPQQRNKIAGPKPGSDERARRQLVR